MVETLDIFLVPLLCSRCCTPWDLHAKTHGDYTVGLMWEWESVVIQPRPLGDAAYMYVACLPLLCQGSKWLNGKSVWLVFRRSWVQIPARSRIFSMDLFLTLSTKILYRVDPLACTSEYQPCSIVFTISLTARLCCTRRSIVHVLHDLILQSPTGKGSHFSSYTPQVSFTSECSPAFLPLAVESGSLWD